MLLEHVVGLCIDVLNKYNMINPGQQTDGKSISIINGKFNINMKTGLKTVDLQVLYATV